MKTLIATTFAAAVLVSGAAVAETVTGETGHPADFGQVAVGAPISGAVAPANGYHAEIGELALFAPAEAEGREVLVHVGDAAGFTGGAEAAAGLAGDAASGAERVLR